MARVNRSVPFANAELLFCELPDGTRGTLPAWMTNAARLHSSQTLASQPQKRRSVLYSRGRATVLLYTASWWRRARFSGARWRWPLQRTGRSRRRWSRRVIIELGLSPDQS